MKLMSYELIKIARSALSHFEKEEIFRLNEFQTQMVPLFDEQYDVDRYQERFRNHCYRAIRLLEQENLVCRLSAANYHNALYVAIEESVGVKVQVTEKKTCALEGELTYKEGLIASKYELEKVAEAHRSVLSKFPAHKSYLNAELDKVTTQIESLEYQLIVLDKLIIRDEINENN